MKETARRDLSSKGTGEIKVRGIGHKRAKQRGPRLAWIMIHKIVNVYRDVQKEENLHCQSLVASVDNIVDGERQDTGMVRNSNDTTNMERNADEIESTTPYLRNEITKDETRKTLAELTILPTDLAEIQPRSSQVWNCGEIGIDPNGK